MRRALAATILALAPACNLVFGLDAPADDTGDDAATIDAAAGDGDVPIDAPPGCGDDIHDPDTEQCDDGNLVPYDGCNAGCRLEVNIGCADGTREGVPEGNELIAACAGAWSNAGLTAQASPASGCLDTGNDGPPQAGALCSAVNLCAAGWHICTGLNEATIRLSGADCGEGFETGFYATNQPSDGAGRCIGTGTNDIFGCGDLGAVADATCAPLTRASGELCVALSGDWQCTTIDTERADVIKLTAVAGGVLCCR